MDEQREALRRRLARRVRDPRVLDALVATPRELYVPPELAPHAYEDRALPLAEGQTISQPSMVAWMLEELELAPGERVLDVGTGSGYQAAILARLVERVFAMELRIALARRALRNWVRDPGAAGRCLLVVADAHLGFPGRIDFDAIAVAAAAPSVPEALLAQLAPGGRLVAPIGPPAMQELIRIRRRRDGTLGATERLGGCAFVPLVRH